MRIDIKNAVGKVVGQVNQQVASRAFRASNELRNAALNVLRGERSGRVYRKPFSNKTYRASAPGEPPAVRSGALRLSWKPVAASQGKSAKTYTVTPAIKTDVKYAPILNKGYDGDVTVKTKGGKKKTYHLTIAPRPFEEPIIEMAKPKVFAIFNEPYSNK